MEIINKHILITGANRGIGLAIAEALAVKGAHVHVAVRTLDLSLESSLKKRGAASVTSWQLDLSQRESIEHFAQTLTAPIDILINNAGQLTGGLLEEQKTQEIYSMFQVNLVGLIHLTALLLPSMIARGEGKIVNNASVSGILHFPCASTYTAAKSGVVAFTDSLRQELRGTGVSTLLLLTPGVKTRMFDKIPELYGNSLEVDFLSAVSPETWAGLIVKAIEDDRPILYPSGSGRATLALGQHLPGLFESMIAKKFKRRPSLGKS